MGLDSLYSLYCGKCRKISKLRCDFYIDQTMPNVELVQAIFIYYSYVQVSSGLNHDFLSYHTHTHTHTHNARAHTHTGKYGERQTHRRTEGDEYSIIDKL